MTRTDEAGSEAGQHTCLRQFLLRSLREAAWVDPASSRQGVSRPVAPGERGQGAPEARDRQNQGHSRYSRRLPRRHRPGLGHRRLRDGDVDHARRTPGRGAGVGEFRRRLGHRRHQAAQAERRPRRQGRLRQVAEPGRGRFRQGRAVHLERHDVGRPGAERRLDSCQSGGFDLRRCDVGRVRAADRLVEVRRHYVFLAKGARR